MSKIFTTNPVRKPRKNAFNLSHEVKMSLNMGDLVPILCQEVIPGDRFRVNTEMAMRLAPMIAPVMHRVNVFTHYFFVPNRLVWDDWKDFITGGKDGTARPSFPRIMIGKGEAYWTNVFKPGSLADYLGYPVMKGPAQADTYVSSLPFRAYQLIYNEYYRDQNLVDEIKFPTTSSLTTTSTPDSLTIPILRKRSWEKDYFTSALPWPQRGNDISIPIAQMGDIPIRLDQGALDTQTFISDSISDSGKYSVDFSTDSQEGNLEFSDQGGNPCNIYFNPGESLYGDASGGISSATINELRRAFALQKWEEINARGGSRYIEQILAHFGVRTPDYTLQRPQFLGGGKTPVVFSEVLQTSSSDESSPQGNMAGHGASVGNTHQFSHFFNEHGFIIGIMSILPRTAYQQGIEKQFVKFDRFDYYFPTLAHLGEMPVKNKELYYDFDNPTWNEGDFGYQPQYTDYRFKLSTVHGDFRDSLSFWHMGRIFTGPPKLNGDFVTSNPTTRIFAVQDNSVQKVYVQLYHNVKAIRPVSRYGLPGI